jgi:hypothetical protein
VDFATVGFQPVAWADLAAVVAEHCGVFVFPKIEIGVTGKRYIDDIHKVYIKCI